MFDLLIKGIILIIAVAIGGIIAGLVSMGISFLLVFVWDKFYDIKTEMEYRKRQKYGQR